MGLEHIEETLYNGYFDSGTRRFNVDVGEWENERGQDNILLLLGNTLYSLKYTDLLLIADLAKKVRKE